MTEMSVRAGLGSVILQLIKTNEKRRFGVNSSVEYDFF